MVREPIRGGLDRGCRSSPIGSLLALRKLSGCIGRSAEYLCRLYGILSLAAAMWRMLGTGSLRGAF
jgi:hypothetical protein